MSLTLRLTDRGTLPTGFTAEVTGSAGGAVSLWIAAADEPFSGITFGQCGARTGDGSLSVEYPPGFVFVTVRSGADCTVPRPLAITDGQDCCGVRVQAAIAARLKLLNLDGIGMNIHEQFIPEASELRYPCGNVHWVGAIETEETGLNALDYIVYPVQVDFYDLPFKATQHEMRKRYLNWREQAGQAFRHQRLAGVPESAWCDVQFRAAVDPAAANEAGQYIGSLTVRAVCRLTRGLGA
jgi:hypothetical protein